MAKKTKKKASKKKVPAKRLPRRISPVSTAKKREKFLEAFRESGNVSHSASVAVIDRKTHHNWLKASPEYAAAFADAKEDAADFLEKKAWDRACGTSDTLLIFLLKGLRPEKFRERYEHAHTGREGGPIEIKFYIPDNGRRHTTDG